MRTVNKAILIGVVGNDPECRDYPSGSKVNFSIATHTYKDESIWHEVVCFKNVAETAQKYVKKRALVYVDGSINYYSYPTSDGKMAKKTSIIANVIRVLDSGGGIVNRDSEVTNNNVNSTENGINDVIAAFYNGPENNGKGEQDYAEDIPF